MYDWANSVYSLTISSAIFPAYYETVTEINNSDMVSFFGLTIDNTSLYSYGLAFAFLFVAFVSPILGGIADYVGNKKPFMKAFAYTGAIACISMFWFTDVSMLEFGIIAMVIAAIGFTGSLVFYNAYLPEIAPKEEHDQISAKGFSYGYIGSVILLIINLVLIMFHDKFGLEKGFATRLAFVMVGIWWIGFSQITFANMPKSKKGIKPKNLLSNGFNELGKVWKEFQSIAYLRRFIPAFFFFTIGVQTVIYLAANFGSDVLGMETEQLIVSILLIQIVAIGGSYLFSTLSKKIGNVKALIICVTAWMFICAGAYFVTSVNAFYIVAAFVGMVMGGVQSLSRSTYSKMLPPTNDTASYFSFYDVTEKIATAIGLLSFGLIVQLTGSMPNAILALIVFFVIGLVLLLRVKFSTNDVKTQGNL